MERTAQDAILDTLAFATELRKVGVARRQAEKHAELLARTLSTAVVTPRDLDQKLEQLELRLIIKLGFMQAASIGILATLMKLV